MKPKFRSLAAAFAPLSRSSLIVCATLCAAGAVHAADGTWTGVTSGGNWGDTANWSGGIVAGGAGFTADLSTVDLPAGVFNVILDAPRTVGNINFGDVDQATAGTWSMTGANTLTLASGSAPLLTAGVNATIASVVGGTGGFTKLGAATLNLTADNSAALTGPVLLKGGVVSLITGSAVNLQKAIGAATNTVTFEGGTLALNGSTVNDNGSTIWGPMANPLFVGSGQTGTINCFPRGAVSSVLTGDGTLNIGIRATRCDFTGNWSAFAGNINVTSLTGAPEFRVAGTGQFASAKVSLGTGVKMLQSFNPTAGDAGTVQNIGELSGVAGSLLAAQPVGGRFVNWTIGALNTDSTFAGNIIDDTESGNGFGACRIVKVGSGTLTLTGTNTFTGSSVTTPGVRVNAGTLAIGDGGASGSLGNTNTQVAVDATLVFNRDNTSVSVYPGVLSGAGNVIKRGSGQVNFTGVNTYTSGTGIEGGTIGINSDASLGDASGSVNFSNANGGIMAIASGVASNRTFDIAAGVVASFGGAGAADTLTLGGLVSGSGSVNINGAGFVELAGANTYSGTTSVTSGSLVVTNASGSATSTGAVSIAGGNLGGTGIITGAVSVAAGSGLKPGLLTSVSSGVGAALNVGALSLAGGSTVFTEFSNASSYDRIIVADTNGLTSSGTVGNPVLVDLRVANSTAKWTTPGTYDLIQFAGAFTGNPDDVFEVSPSSKQSGLTYEFSVSGNFIRLTIGGTLPSEWNVDSSGNWSLASNWLNGIPGATGATANFLGAITAPRTVTLDSNRTVGVLQFNNANAYTIAGTSTLTFDQTSGLADLSVVLGDHIISTDVALNDTLSVSFGTAAESVALNGAISGPGGITKTGGGDIILGGSNTFLGNVAFDTGTLSFANGGLGAGDLAIGNASLVWLPGNTQDISNRAVTFSAGPITFDIGAGDVTLANAFGGASGAAFNKLGAGKLTLAADADFTGPVAISGGPLQLGTGGAAGAVSGAISNNGGLIVSRSADLALFQVISGTGFLTHQGASVLTLGGANSFSGDTTIADASGSLLLGNSLALQNSTLLYGSTGGTVSFGTLTAATLGGLSGNKDLELANTTPAGVALTVGGNNSTTLYSGALSGAGSLTKAGTGTLTLAGTSSIAGGTTLAGGILEISAAGSLATAFAQVNTGMLSLNGGSLVCTATSTINTGGAAGGIHILNSGTATFATVQSGTADNGLLALEDGTLDAVNVIMQRTANLGTADNPTAVPDGSGLVVTGGTATISGVLTVGTSNSGASALINGGVTTVNGVVTIGNTSNTRWSALEVRDGVFTSTDIASGVVLSPNAGTANRSAFIVSGGGIATVEKVTFGADGAAAGIGRVAVTGGTLFVGSGGMVQATPVFTPQINLGGGTLAAKASWSTNLPVNLVDLTTSVVSAANANGDPFDITLGGALTGTGGLEKDGDGMLTLAGGHSYAGNTNVLNGVLRVQTKTFDDAATVGVELGAGATLDLAFGGGDRVAIFKIDGTQMADGIYGSLTNATPGIIQTAAITGPGLLYVNTEVPPSGYDSWASSNGLTAGNNGPNDDPDNDGIDNLLEFVLGGLPLVSSTDVLPDLAVDASNFVFTFNRNDDSEAEVALVFQYGSTLAGWADVAIDADGAPADANGVIVNVAEGTPASNPDAITVTVPRTQAVSGKLFGRVVARK